MFYYVEYLGWIGLACIIYHLSLSIYNIIYVYLIAEPIDLGSAAGGKWAVVTGSADGIGREYALELARRGFSILLIDKQEVALEKTKREVESVGKVQVQIIVFDFSCAILDEYEKRIFNILDGLDIGILVNNVGVRQAYIDLLHNTEEELESYATVNIVNTLPCILLTTRVLKQMIIRDNGIIVNISSLMAPYAPQFLAMYSSTKQMVRKFTTCITKECASRNIIIQCLIPSFIATNTSKLRPSLHAPIPKDFVMSAIRTIGLANETTGYIMHQIQAEIFRSTPQFILTYLSNKMLDVRRKRAVPINE